MTKKISVPLTEDQLRILSQGLEIEIDTEKNCGDDEARLALLYELEKVIDVALKQVQHD